jgi:protein O-GlcNAc transferase
MSVSKPTVSNAETQNLQEILKTHTCPACGYYAAVSFYDGGKQPLTTLAWPKSTEEAQAMKRLPLSFVRCIDCGHVYNTDFDYNEVPYSEKPNLMFNKGVIWSRHLAHVSDRILDYLPQNPVVVEIGCGSGHLLKALWEKRPEGRYIGFDPNAAVDEVDEHIEVVQALFEPGIHLAEYRPDLIISRHVLEHLINPLGFVQSLAFAANWHGIETQLFIEVPCIDRVFAIGRSADFFYEHNSHFTTVSLIRMLTRAAIRLELVERGYNDEVVYAFARLGAKPEQMGFARESLAFRQQAMTAQETIFRQLDTLSKSGQSVAFWGGTGKGAAFINRYNVDNIRFPLVVDSDADKLGTYVPGTGQAIRFPDILREQPVAVIIITTQWRACDILLEIEQRGIPYEMILLEHEGRLVNYFTEPHPYHMPAEETSTPSI